jgi:hypothetical protein
VLADAETIKNMPPNLSPQKRAEWLAGRIMTVSEVEGLNLGRWRSVINTKVRFGIVAGIFQAASLTKLFADEEKSMANENTDARMRMYAGITAVAATTGEVIGNALVPRAAQGLPLGQGLAATVGSKLASVAGRAGIAAGLFVACLDAKKAYDSRQENQIGLAWLYGISAVAGAGLTLAVASMTMLGAAAIPIIGIIVLILIGIGIWIEYVKDNPIQDWLERCPWGILPAERYPNMATEQAQLVQALK